MRKIYLSFILVCILVTGSFAQTVIVAGADAATVAGSPYTTLKATFDNINLVSQAGNTIVISITGTTTETASAVLNQSVGPWASLSVIPVGIAAVTGNVANLVDLRGADNITIDGLNTGGNSLTFTNTSVSAGSTFAFYGDASNNTITRCTILGSSTAFGTIFFGDGTVTGNDNNSITQCDISAAAGGLPLYAILSIGLSTAVDNSNNTIAMNTISDYYYDLDYSAGILVFANNSAWTINSNKIYQTASRTYTSSFTHYGIRVTAGDAYNIENNIIGFANAAGTGTTNMIGLSSGSLGGSFPSSFTAGGIPAILRYTAISYAFTPGGIVSSIQNNTIGGIALYTGSAATATNGMLCGIAVISGNANIGTVTGNTIGSVSGAGSIYVASTSAGGVIAGIYCTSSNTINIQNNSIGGIDASGTTVAQATGFKGIDIAGTGTFTVSNNNVGNATANNIRTGYLLTGANLSNNATTPTAASGGGVIRGIVSSVTGSTVDISNNIIRGIQISGNASTFTGISSTGTVTTTMNINANQVGNAGTNAVTFAFATGGAIHGINIFPNASASINLNNNSIYGINCPAANSIAGIITSGGVATATLNINNNSFINNVISGAAVSTSMSGITNSAIVSILNITGNIIRNNSSTATSGNFNGIQNTAAVVNAVTITNNQLGNASGGAITCSAATSGSVNCIYNTNSASTCTININNNFIDGIHVVSSGPVFGIYNSGNSAAAININDNQLGSVTGTLITFDGAQSFGLFGLSNYGGTAATILTIQGNDIRGIVQPVASTGFYQFITSGGTGFSQNVLNNTFTNITVNTNNAVYFIWKESSMGPGASWTCSNNRIVTGFTKTRAGSNIMFIFSFGSSVSGSTMTETGNNFSNVTVAGGSTQIWGINNLEGASVASSPAKTITGNMINNLSGGTIVAIQLDKGASIECSSNFISNLSGTTDVYGISHGSNIGPGTCNISSNNISTLNSTSGNAYGISGGNTNSASININGNTITGILSGGFNLTATGISLTNAQLANIFDNTINNLGVSGTSSPVANGIWVINGTTVNVYKNKIHTITATAALALASPAVNGMLLSAGTTVTAYNNFIANLTAPAVSLTDAIRGISVVSTTAATTYNLYFNSIYINASSSGTNFGTSGIYHTSNATATTAKLNMTDNIIVNTSTPKGTGTTVAYRRSNATLTNYFSGADYNLFYAGSPGVQRLIFYDGTNSDQTLSAYQTRVGTRDANSISLMPAFVSTTDLHLTSANCRIDGRGIPVAAVTTDIDLAARNATTPDMGADEFTAAVNTTLAGVVGAAICEDRTVSVTGTTYTSNICDLIASVLPSGAAPVAGKINACVTLDATAQTFNGDPYVQRHFDIEPLVSPATATGTITLYFTDAEFVLYNTSNPVVWPRLPTAVLGNADPNRANVKVTQFHGAASTSPSSPGNYPGVRVLIDPVDADVSWNGNYWAVTFDVTGFSGFYVHTNNFNAPLPIVVNYLTGRRQGNDHLFNWKVTCSNTARAMMTLERSADSRNFTAINTITADAVRCQQPFDYTDANPLVGMNYYRLKIVDADGKITYSTTVALLNAVKGFDIISIAPNPVVNNNFKLNVASAQSGKMEIVIADMQGRLVKRQTLSLIAGFNSLPVNISQLAAGTYSIQATIADERPKLVRFVKQ